MKLIHFLSALCLTTATVSSASQLPTTDAHLIARTVKNHMKSALDPRCTQLQKALKSHTKKVNHEIKQEMRDAQKKAQELCNEEKKRLYDEFSSLKKEHLAQQEHDLAILTTLPKKQDKHRTLKALISGAYEYISVLQNYNKLYGDDTAKTALHTEKEWFENIEKSSNQAGISLNQTIETDAPITQKKKKEKNKN